MDESFFESLCTPSSESDEKTPESKKSEPDKLSECLESLDKARIKVQQRQALKTITKALYGSGIHVKDIPALKFGDVFDVHGKAKAEIETRKGAMAIPCEVQSAFEDYRSSLRANTTERITAKTPLFKDYPCDKKITRHLEKYAETRSTTLRQAGVRNAFKDKSAAEVADQYGRTERHVQAVWMNRIEPNGAARKRDRTLREALGKGEITEIESILLRCKRKDYDKWLATGKVPPIKVD